MKYFVTVGEETLELDVEQRPDGSYRVRDSDGTESEVRLLSNVCQPGLVSLLVDGHAIEAQPDDAEVHFRQERFAVRAESLRERAATRAASGEAAQSRRVFAPMPGRIVRILCEPGQAVPAGSALVVIEAMKMQNELCAKAEAVVRAVHVSVGQAVERGAVLIEFERTDLTPVSRILPGVRAGKP
jgi:biotin carboxyl carrier protein